MLTLLRLAGMPLRADARTHHDPLVMIGGAVTFVNPEPLALFADVIAAGEGEALIPSLLRGVQGAPAIATTCCGGCVAERGFYIPSFYDVHYAADGTIARVRAARGHRRAAGREEGGAEDDRGGGSAGDDHLHAGDRVRLAIPRRGRARVRQPVPVLLGRLQLPAGARVSEGAHPASWRSRRSRTRIASGLVSIALCDHPDIEEILTRLVEMGYLDQPGVAPARRPDADDSSAAARERRADDHDRAGNRLGPAAPRHQQDGHERRDPGGGRDDLRQRHREPEAVLHDRPADGDRRRPGRDSRPDAAAARDHADARARRAARSAASSAA